MCVRSPWFVMNTEMSRQEEGLGGVRRLLPPYVVWRAPSGSIVVSRGQQLALWSVGPERYHPSNSLVQRARMRKDMDHAGR